MTPSARPDDPSAALTRIITSARALGVEMDEEEAIQWLTAVAATQTGEEELRVDRESGVFAHRVVLLDFDPADLERVRRVAALVEIADRPEVETAIALSGSSAQSHIQTFPGDFDYFERVNIRAATRVAACDILADVLREKALTMLHGPGYQLTEVRFGTFRHPVIRGDQTLKPGASIAWTPAEISAGYFDVLTPEGDPLTIDWAYAAADPGWCKLDWVLVDPAHPRAVKASNMLDVTWEDESGRILPLDGFIDPYYQEVYLDAASIPLFSKISRQMEPDALYRYVRALEEQIVKYTRGDGANFGKAAKRMYNVFRLTGRFEQAAYVRELFDEPAALLYQAGALLDGVADLGSDSEAIDQATLADQIDDLIRVVSTVAEGPPETALIMNLLRVRDDLTGVQKLGDAWEQTLQQMQANITAIVNVHFEEQLRAVPQIDAYMRNLG